jgi:hypothetical protein
VIVLAVVGTLRVERLAAPRSTPAAGGALATDSVRGR